MSIFNAHAEFKKRPWLKDFFRIRYHWKDVRDGEVKRLDAGLIHDYFTCDPALNSSLKHAHIFSETGVWICDVGKIEKIFPRNWFTRMLGSITEEYSSESLHARLMQVFETTTTQHDRVEPYFVVTSTEQSDRFYFTLYKPPQNESPRSWFDKKTSEALSLQQAQEEAIDQV